MLVAVVAMTASSGSISAVASGNNPSANGHGNLTTNDELRTFSFHARTRNDGTVTGSATLHNRDQDVFLKLDINCLTVVGNTASVSGVISRHSNPSFIGRTGIFQVVDNGEGSGNPSDQMSLVFIFGAGSPVDCNTGFILPQNTVEGGNVQVKP